MHARHIKALALTTCTVFAVTAIADFPSSSGYGFGTVASAQAGNGNGNGNGGEKGNAGGNGGGNGGGNSGGNSSSAGSQGNGHGVGGGVGKSGGLFGVFSAKTKSSASKNNSKSLLGSLGLGFGRDKDKTAKSRTASAGKRSNKAPTAKIQLASVPTPHAKPAKEKNFRAKLAGLNSLNRNYHAYMNSQDPRLDAIRSYMMASIDYERAAETLAEALANLAPAQDAFAETVASLYGGLTTYDGFSPTDPDIDSLNTRLGELETLDPSTLTTEGANNVQNEIDAINSALSSDEATTLGGLQNDVDNAQDTVDGLADQVSDEALTEALLAAANENRVNEYGTDNYVDSDMLDWAKNLLGVDDAYGKIDQMREALDAEAETAGAEAPATEETDS